MERRTAENIEQEDSKIFIGQKDSRISDRRTVKYWTEDRRILDSRTAGNCTGGDQTIRQEGISWTGGQLIIVQEDIRLLDRKA